VYDVALKLCILAAVGLVAVGALALFSPRRLARSYGVEVRDRASLVWVRATGVRDAGLGLILAYIAYHQEFIEILFICAVGFVLAITDFLLAVTFARRLRSEHGAHLGGAIAFLVIIVLLLIP
jgi:hypothetical protein